MNYQISDQSKMQKILKVTEKENMIPNYVVFRVMLHGAFMYISGVEDGLNFTKLPDTVDQEPEQRIPGRVR